MKTLIALVGMKHRKSETLVAGLPAGEELTLIREPDNRFDSRAVQVWARGIHVGYLKQTQNQYVAAAMDAAIQRAQLPPKAVTSIGKLSLKEGGWPMVEVDE